MDSLNCPLTCDIFRDPVIGQDGHTYEREDITTWLQQHGTSPITREPMTIESLRPNHIVRKMIEEFTAISKKKDYHFSLDVDVRKTQMRPWLETFGKSIYKAEWISRQGPPIVLIKIDGAKATREASFYVQLSCHPHIVRTFGLVESDPHSIMLLQEYAEKGNLTKLLQENKFRPTKNVLVEIFVQIIDAMICLAHNKIVHGNLACRNVLVFRCNANLPEENLMKLTDFGLSQGSDIFSPAAGSSRTTMTDIPVRYAAPEILQTNGHRMSYSEKSDVYSMGVLMWEACSYGISPYSSLADDNHIRHIKLRGDQLPRPKICDENLWLTMTQCLRLETNERPTFKELRRKITRVDQYHSLEPIPATERKKMLPQSASIRVLFSNEPVTQGGFEAYANKIPCEFCDRLINFDEYLIHTRVCTDNQHAPLNREVQSIQSMQITTETEILPVLVSKRNTNTIEITVIDLDQNTQSLSSSAIYRITTKTSLSIFKKTQFSVNHDYTGFFEIHGRLVLKHLPRGIIIPALPENNSNIVPNNLNEQRRAQFERYLNRLVRNKTLVSDPDFLIFLELPAQIKKGKDNLWKDLLSTSTIKIQQGDWFDEKYKFIIELQTDLKKLKSQFDFVYKQREESNLATKALVTQLSNLATLEDHSDLSWALFELNKVFKKLEQIDSDHTQQEFLLMNELFNEYLLHLDMVKYAFNERAKAHKSWLNAVNTFKKKKAQKGQDAETESENLKEEIVKDMENYERISITLKKELELFQQTQIEEFKKNIRSYIKQMLGQQEKVLEVWEAYLPISKMIPLTD